MIEAYVANLAWLNTGLAGPEPLKLPADFEAAQSLLEKLGTADGKHDVVITEYRADIPGLTKHLSQYDNLDELNYLASLLDGMDEAGREKFAAAIAHGEHTGDVDELINLAQNLDCYDLYPDVADADQLGRLRAEGRLALPEDCRFYFDYGAYGEDTAINEGGEFTAHGYIHNNRSEFTQHYNGRDIPAEYRLFARPEPEHSQPAMEGGRDMSKKARAVPLAKNKDVQELLALMEANNLPTAKDLRDVVAQVTALEQDLHKAVEALDAARQELAQAQNHPFKASMQNSVDSMQALVNVMRERLADLKDKIIEGCQNALAAVKDKGLSALRGITDFFKVKPMLEGIRADLDMGIKQNEATIRKIVSMSNEYHKAGLHVKNMGRAMIGKEALTEAKSPGKLAVAIAAPFRNERRHQVKARERVTKAIDAIDRLQNRDRKEPVMETVAKLNKQIEDAKKTAPVQVRPRPVTHDGR